MNQRPDLEISPGMSSNTCPRLRSHLALARLDPGQARGKEFLLHDRLRISTSHISLSSAELRCLELFDGTRSLSDIQVAVMQLFGGQWIPLEAFASLAERLDQALFLDTPRFRNTVDAPVRPPSCVGVYDGDAEVLRRQMRQLFTHPHASGQPGEPKPNGRLRAVLAPHIDYHRGGLAYTYAFKELFENTQASLFVIIGTSHYCPWKRFTLTRKSFRTPLGVVPTDQDYIDRLVAHYGKGLFEDEWIAHLPEHSIELEVIFLHYLYDQVRPIRIVPLVVGSFEDCTSTGDSPLAREEIRRMITALQAVERETQEPICYVISGDLAHIGPKFGALEPLRESQLRHSRIQDHALLVMTEKVDPDGYLDIITQERDVRNICGLPPTWVTLTAAKPATGRLLRYDQYVEPSGHESVSFASIAFYA